MCVISKREESAQKNAAQEAQTEAPKINPEQASCGPPSSRLVSSCLLVEAPDKPGELEKAEDWSERDMETLKCKLRDCRCQQPDHPKSGCGFSWIGNSQALMKDFWLCGAAIPVLDLDTELVLPGERRSTTEASLLMLLGIPNPHGQRISAAHGLNCVIRLWWSSRSSDMQEDGASAWVANCLYHHVYPLLGQEQQAEPTTALCPDTSRSLSSAGQNRLEPYRPFGASAKVRCGICKQHQAVHEYLSSGKGFKSCDVARSVSEEFKSANLARHAEVNPALVLSCLREDTRSSLDTLTAIELLGYVQSEELPAEVVSALQGLKL
ncbi:SACS, partial [Symbiodinium necroappetens]